MWRTFLLALCYLSSIIRADHPPPLYTIDVTEPVRTQFGPICHDYYNKSRNVANFILDALYSKLLPNGARDVVEAAAASYLDQAPKQYREELLFFAKCLDYSPINMTIVNLYYAITDFCTSIVAKGDAQDEHRIYHARNQDYPPIMRQTLAEIVWINSSLPTGRQEVYRTISFVGYAGAATGRVPNGFSVTIDARHSYNYLEDIGNIFLGYWPAGFLVRHALQTAKSFDEAIDIYTNTKIQSPVYYIVGGLKENEGAVLSRNATDNVNTWRIGDSDSYGWFLVETNYDHWKPPPPADDRRDPAIRSMKNMSQAGMTSQGLFEVLSRPPVLNIETLYTTVMSASDPDLFMTMIRDHK